MKLKKFVSVSLAAALLACSLTVSASANTVDRDYAFYDIAASSWVSTGTAKKDTVSEVYAAPTDSPNGTTLVKTYCNVGGSAADKTTYGTAYLTNGYKYAINNYVYEDGDKYNGQVTMWLKMTPEAGRGRLRGVWSPDFTPESGVIYV